MGLQSCYRFKSGLRQRQAAALYLVAALAAGGAGCSKSSRAPAARDTVPPVISGVASGSVGAKSVTISWTTNEPSDSQAEYGTTAGYGRSSPLDQSRTTAHLVLLSGLTTSTVYHFRVRSRDAAGNLALSGDFTFTTTAEDTTRPSISGVSATALAATSATIVWTTSEASDSQVDYGTTPGYGQSSSLDPAFTTSHAVSLAGLAASTLYHYRVRSKDAAGNVANSGDFTFATIAAPDKTPPVVTMTAPASGATVSGTVTLSADATDDVGVASVQFLLDGAGVGAPALTAPYSITWNSTGAANGTHTLAARARDSAGNEATSAGVTVIVSNSLTLELAPAVGGFTHPLDLHAPDDGTGRLFVVEQGGAIRIILPSGQVLPAPFVDVSTRPGFTSGGETGLLGLAFHPAYAANGRLFVNYTRTSGPQLQTVIAEFRASFPGSDTANPASERILLTWDQPFSNHNGGGLAFGRDGLLYIGLGDGGSGGDPLCNGQNLNTLLGKILRIDVDSAPPPGQQYVIPASNPFAGQASRRGEIWLYGLRNPFRFSFDLAGGTDLYIGDVGQNAFEEVDLLGAGDGGANLGWNLREGAHPYSSACSLAGSPPMDPIYDYSHASGDTAVTGGYVYRGAAIPALVGAYVFGDFTSGRVWTLTRDSPGQWSRSAGAVLSVGNGNLSAFGQGQDGELYVVRYASGDVAQIRQVR